MNIIYAALAGAMLMLVSFIGGCHYEQGKAEAQAASVRAQDVQIAKAMQPQLTHTITEIQTVTHTNTVRIPYAVNHIIYQDRVVERPAYLFTRADVMCWNSALHIAGAPACPDSTTASPEAFALTGTSIADAFANLNDNGDACAKLSTVAAGWQLYWDHLKKVKP